MLYRFLNRHYVEELRDQGMLRLNPLHVYRSSSDNRQDASEGIKSTRISGVGSLSREQAKAFLGVDNTITFGHGGSLVHNLHLLNGFLISTSTRYEKRLLARFACDGCFAITDPDEFKRSIALAIASTVPVFRVIEGAVVYVDEKQIGVDVRDLVQLGTEIREAEVGDYFVKSRNPYEMEAEYRFVFLVNSVDTLQPIDVRLSTDAIRACCEFDLPLPAD